LKYPPDSITDSYVPERFYGVKSRLCFESSAWSPIGVSEYGNSLLAVAVFSDRTPHFKILDYSIQHGVSYKFEEVYSLMEILRKWWFVIPIFNSDGTRQLLPDLLPSLSLCLLKYSARMFVTWADTKLGEHGLLLLGFGSFVFVWIITSSRCEPLCCIAACDDNDSVDNISAHVPNDLLVSVTVETVKGPKLIWNIQLVNSDTRIGVGSCHITEADNEPMRIKQPDPSVLSTALSTNRVDVFSAIRTRKGIQIITEPSEFSPTTVEETLTLLIYVLRKSKEATVLDIVRRLASVYRPIAWDIGNSSIRDHPIETVLRRFTQSEGIVADFSSLDRLERCRVAFGLHHIHSQIDPVARSGKNLRMKERSEIISLVIGRTSSDEISCVECGSLSTVDFHGYKLYSVCHQRGHKVPLCMLSMEPIQSTNQQEQISECCWCLSIYKSPPGEGVGICRICRIGIVSQV